MTFSYENGLVSTLSIFTAVSKRQKRFTEIRKLLQYCKFIEVKLLSAARQESSFMMTLPRLNNSYDLSSKVLQCLEIHQWSMTRTSLPKSMSKILAKWRKNHSKHSDGRKIAQNVKRRKDSLKEHCELPLSFARAEC